MSKTGEHKYRVTSTYAQKKSDGNYGSVDIFVSATVGFDDPGEVTDKDIINAIEVQERISREVREAGKKQARIVAPK